MYTPVNFLIDHYLPKELHTIYSDIEKIQLMDERILRLSDIAYTFIEDNFGPTEITIQEGLVIPNGSETILDQHCFGRAVHIKIKVFDILELDKRIEKYNELREMLLKEEEFKYATIESISYKYPQGLPYLHIDVRNNLTNSRLAREQNDNL